MKAFTSNPVVGAAPATAESARQATPAQMHRVMAAPHLTQYQHSPRGNMPVLITADVDPIIPQPRIPDIVSHVERGGHPVLHQTACVGSRNMIWLVGPGRIGFRVEADSRFRPRLDGIALPVADAVRHRVSGVGLALEDAVRDSDVLIRRIWPEVALGRSRPIHVTLEDRVDELQIGGVGREVVELPVPVVVDDKTEKFPLYFSIISITFVLTLKALL